MSLPDFKCEKNKKGRLTDINGKKVSFMISKCVSVRQSDYPEKFILLQEIIFPDNKKEVRIGYYIIGKKGNKKGKWVWGQFATFLPKKDLKKLIKKAEAAGIL